MRGLCRCRCMLIQYGVLTAHAHSLHTFRRNHLYTFLLMQQHFIIDFASMKRNGTSRLEKKTLIQNHNNENITEIMYGY